ncbi:MAG: UvrD-helicase domain-containing protein [Eubacterium sp.]|nr:UvrD-helicase domain-containing protein [Eubacterium sp.]
MIFNRQQQEAINSIEGNISIIASAGSGKTTMLTHRIKNMTENHGISPSSILAVTFSRKAKDNILYKLEELGIGGVHVETFHSLALKMIFSAYGTNRFQVWTAQWEREKIVGDICISLHLCSSDDVPYNDIFSFIALQKVNMRKPTEILVYPDELPFEQKDMQAVYVAYEKEKEQRGYIEFDDFLNMTNEVFDTDPETAKMYRNLFQYVLVDEFQDMDCQHFFRQLF